MATTTILNVIPITSIEGNPDTHLIKRTSALLTSRGQDVHLKNPSALSSTGRQSARNQVPAVAVGRNHAMTGSFLAMLNAGIQGLNRRHYGAVQQDRQQIQIWSAYGGAAAASASPSDGVHIRQITAASTTSA